MNICNDNISYLKGKLIAEQQITSTIEKEKSLKSKLEKITPIFQNKSELVFSTKLEFPSVGESGIIYISCDENASYRWDNENLKFICIGRDYSEIETIDGGKA